jgi:hypothetical protein
MKPDWKYAPEWAEFLAMDPGGSWCWYKLKPEPGKYSWESDLNNQVEFSGAMGIRWQDTMEPRP